MLIQFLSMFGIVAAVILGFYLTMNLRYWFTGEEFRGTCASNNPMLKDELGECTLCGKRVGEDCKMPDEHNGSDDSLPSPGTAGA